MSLGLSIGGDVFGLTHKNSSNTSAVAAFWGQTTIGTSINYGGIGIKQAYGVIPDASQSGIVVDIENLVITSKQLGKFIIRY